MCVCSGVVKVLVRENHNCKFIFKYKAANLNKLKFYIKKVEIKKQNKYSQDNKEE